MIPMNPGVRRVRNTGIGPEFPCRAKNRAVPPLGSPSVDLCKLSS